MVSINRSPSGRATRLAAPGIAVRWLAAAHLAEQRPDAVAGRCQVAAHRLQRGRPEVAGVAGAELIGLRGADNEGAAAGGVLLHVGDPQGRDLADTREGVAHEENDGAVAQAPQFGPVVRGALCSDRGLLPADGGDLTAPALPPLASDAPEHVAAQSIGGRIDESGDLKGGSRYVPGARHERLLGAPPWPWNPPPEGPICPRKRPSPELSRPVPRRSPLVSTVNRSDFAPPRRLRVHTAPRPSLACTGACAAVVRVVRLVKRSAQRRVVSRRAPAQSATPPEPRPGVPLASRWEGRKTAI